MKANDNLPPGVSINDPHINPPDDEETKIYTVMGRKVRLHPECESGFREDRKHGLIYPQYYIEGRYANVEEASIEAEFCAYCND